MGNQTKKAKVKGTDRTVEVYKLKEGTPTLNHIWCNFSGCTETFTADQLEFI